MLGILLKVLAVQEISAAFGVKWKLFGVASGSCIFGLTPSNTRIFGALAQHYRVVLGPTCLEIMLDEGLRVGAEFANLRIKDIMEKLMLPYAC